MSDIERLRQQALQAFEMADYETALNHAAKALNLSGKDAMMWQLQGLAATQLGQFERGVQCFEATAKLVGDNPEVLNNLGIAKRRLGDLEGAIAAYEKSLTLSPNLATTYNNLADVRVAMGEWDQGLLSFRKAVELNPEDSSARFNMANLLRDMGELEDATSHYENLLSLYPDDAEICWNAALAALAQGNWGPGFKLYESRLQLDHMEKPPVPENVERWQGESLAGKTLLIISEQGFGDLFQMLACAARLKERGATILVQCHPRIHKLLSASPVVDEVTDEVSGGTRADYFEWLMSLPGKLSLEAEDVVAKQSWIVKPDSIESGWEASLPQDNRIKVGINFQGSPLFPHDHFRSLALNHFKPIWEREDVACISIQKGLGEEQLEGVPQGSVIALGHLLDNGGDAFVDTARCLDALDILITSDTAVAHLAGGLGCKVWVVLSTVVDWRWGVSGDRSSWYPSMRLFRQRVRGDWSSVIAEISASLDGFSK